ncbi:MAG: carbohydrate-binding family 9-like protein [Phycisphaerales bacterium]
MEAKRTSNPIAIDGQLDEDVWKNAKKYELSLGSDRSVDGTVPCEKGFASIAWDDKYLYVAIEYFDLDIVAEGENDQMAHYLLGDLCELFLKPSNETWYWELYATPHSKMSSFWFPGRGRMGLPSNEKYKCGLKVAAKVYGTLNDWQDKDIKWTAEMAMPVEDLTMHGEKFGPNSQWNILIARQNYGRYLKSIGKELSSCPTLSLTNFHLYEQYALLKFVN